MNINKTRAPQPELFYLEGANRGKEERMRTTAYKEERQIGFPLIKRKQKKNDRDKKYGQYVEQKRRPLIYCAAVCAPLGRRPDLYAGARDDLAVFKPICSWNLLRPPAWLPSYWL